jgi:hypothetical protein
MANEAGENLEPICSLITVSQKLVLKLFFMILERKHWIYSCFMGYFIMLSVARL